MKKYAFILVFGLICSGIISPLRAHALSIKTAIDSHVNLNVLEKSEKKEEKKENKQENKEEKKEEKKNDKKNWQEFLAWFRAFIKQKENSATTTPDTVAPKIKEFDTKIGTTTATITWETNEPATTSFFYSTAEPVTASSTVVSNATLGKDHSVSLSSLTPNTTYFYVIKVTDSAGNTKQTDTRKFHTKKISTDTVVPRISSTFTFQTTSSSTRLVWFTNEPSDSTVWIGTTNPVSTTGTPAYTSATLTYFHDVTLGNLASSTTYFYSVKSVDASGNAATSQSNSFSTSI